VKRLEITPEISDLQVRAAGDGPEHFTIRGHAAVFGRLSENLGGFRERIAQGAFRKVLDQNPDVRLLIDHEPSSVLARTTNGTLELREDPQGLHVWARIRSDLPEAAGLRARLDSGLVDQMSFAFMVDSENDVRSGEDEDGVPIYEVREASELFDVSTVTYGAYPQTDVSLVRMRMLDEPEKAARARDDEQRADDTAEPDVAPAVEAQPDREFLLRHRKSVNVVRARLRD
jgi:HK97 family phage prohead protease